METKPHSLIDIFDTNFGTDQEPIQVKRIVIPMIQRDYAQGRIDPDVNRIRERFLDALYCAVTEEPVTLDFIYGDIDENGVMTPLDGQQRLTTLFLLYWYAAKKENVPESACCFLSNFSYETRYSARYFCIELLRFTPSFTGPISEEIINQAWFPLDWKKDPTISSMLVMLDAVNRRFREVQNLWRALEDKAITFYFLPIKDMGLTDELYIKMNSRGKPLTLFEHFKAELEREIRKVDKALSERIISKIDRDWTDLLWQYRSGGDGGPDDLITDDEFLRYFRLICDIICYQRGESPQNYSGDVFALLKQNFSADAPDTTDHIALLEEYFDCWCQIPGYRSPLDFLTSFMSEKHEAGKILVDSRNSINIFEDCLHSYANRTGRIRQFPLNRVVLLYAIIVYLRNQDKVTESEFRRRLRIVNNLIQNSEDAISDRSDRNRIPGILAQIDAIILTGLIDDALGNNFNPNQLQEEKAKIEYLDKNPGDAEILFRLEDHPMLKGQIGIVGLEHLSLTDRFESLFQCKWDNIDCALIALGDYSQKERNRSHYQFASSRMQFAWDELFHKSSNTGFENTHKILISLLSRHQTFTDKELQEIAEDFLKTCEANQEYPWRYYYIKYPEFRPGSYGKMSNNDMVKTPYLFSVMQTRTYWSSNTYVPYLKAADDAHLSKDSMGQRLVYDGNGCYITCENASYVLKKIEDDSILDTVKIAQTQDGIDLEDRVIKLQAYVKALA